MLPSKDPQPKVASTQSRKRMKMKLCLLCKIGVCASLLITSALGQDWPQWRGPNRDAKAVGFVAPKEWPGELKQKWKVTVGEGVATPAVVADRVYVFSRQDGA